ncbi:hypothetical protein [Modestobacter marinus]|uniref:hypothetical protein n=1 Tax=Modestobacter marinus TaxID=477641 RepID=UPI001C938116|nr:hypothetical protein [Modestobacter marinus]
MTTMGVEEPPSAEVPQRGGFLGSTGSTGRASPRFELTLAVLGAVCSAVATGVLDRLDVSATGKLIGLAVGAALPPFIAVAGRWQHVRVAAATLMTVLALILSYSGWLVFANVSDTEPVVPTPQQVIVGLAGGGDAPADAPAEDPTDAIEMWEGELGIRVSPGSITCDESGACNGVTVTSIGTGLLAITGLELEDEGATTLQASGCDNAQLTQGGKCIITLAFADGKPPKSVPTHLVIHQNFKGPATKVPLVAADPADPTDAIEMWEGELGIRVSPGSITCDESGACNGVTVTSIGTGLLAITGLELEDERATTLQASGCENAQLTQRDSCFITLAFADGGPQESVSTRLVIHQNFRGPATKVPLVAEGQDSSSSNLAVGKAKCFVSGGDPDPDTGEVAGLLTIDVPLSWEGASDPPTVTASVAVDGLQWTSSNVDTAAGTLHVSDKYEGPQPSEIRIMVDSASQFAESDERDNTAVC